MKILAIDTSTDICSVCVIANGENYSKVETNLKQIHSEKLISMIQTCLDNLKLRLYDVDVFAVSIGPGSFTGLRIGLSTIKGLCYALDKPLVAVPTLDALAYKLLRLCKVSRDATLCPVINAKQNDFYFALYKAKNSKVLRISDYLVGTAEDIFERLKGKTYFIGDGMSKLQKVAGLRDEFFFVNDEFSGTDAYFVAIVGIEKYIHEELADIEKIEPMYLKDFTVKTKEGN